MINWGKERATWIIAIETIEASKFQFILTGSRYLECAKKESDYDFFAQDSLDVRAFLNLMEFEELKAPIPAKGADPMYSLDPSVRSVWRLGKVDIQLVEDFELRIKMQTVIKESKLGYLFKDCRLPKKKVDSIVWRAAWQLIKAGKEDAK